MKLIQKKLYFLSSLLLVIATSWNGSLSDGNAKNKRPDVNFYGTIQDHSGKILNVEDILIGTKYNLIPVYQVPATEQQKQNGDCSSASSSSNDTNKKNLDPKQNKIMLNLEDTASIKLAHPDKPVEYEQTINSAKYSEIIVTSITGTTQHFLIESSRDVSCVVIDKGPDSSCASSSSASSSNDVNPILQERKIAMIQIKVLQIKGKKGAVDTNRSYVRQEEENSDKSAIAAKTEIILDEIEKNVNTLSHESSHYEKFKTKMTSLLRSLRDQLQKMLNLIKG